ncbi:MAG: flagellar biosynthesis protein FlhB [Chitinophagales bacterium]
MLLKLFSIEDTREVWIRLVGIFLMSTAVYYFIGAKYELILILKATAFIRFTIIVFFTAFVILELVSASIIIVTVIDFLGGDWTYLMLKKERHFAINKT